MTDRIEIHGIRGFGYHGVLPEERAQGQEFIVDVVLGTDIDRAAASDDLAHTINYADVAVRVHEHITGDPADLIETLAERIARDVLNMGALWVEVAVHKPSAPIPVPFGDVVIRIRRP
ncbi:MAG: 2-amino-4-hydroxy-6-hydroxymethyldihydropteridine diphosphokinase [Actinomycetota bacterium]|jgi:dihydroneopterin aldolase/2-amino-4-hydroxy-6-hydroxymethyldihydropteridine diphosphokinase